MKHIAIIMDGNRRWEKTKPLARSCDGYRKGAEIINQMIEKVIELGVPYLTVYAFSYENWQRPIKEIAAIMNIGMEWLISYKNLMINNGIRCRIIGNRDLIPYGTLNQIEEIEEATAHNSKLNFQVAISYGSRDEILRACLKFSKQISLKKIKTLDEKDFSQFLDTSNIPDPDLLIRTGGQRRLSNYMLWQLAYTELYFIDKLWPDFTKEDLALAVETYNNTQRRFGRI